MTVKVASFFCHVCRRIDQDREQAREVVGLAMQQQKASLSCYRHTDLIRDFQTIATFETFFGKENLDVAQKLGLIPGRKPVKKCNVAPDRPQPFFWEGLGLQAPPSTLL
jgi:hypothetical protein